MTFVQFQKGVLDLSTGTLAYSNAGHNSPWLYRLKDGAVVLKSLTAQGGQNPIEPAALAKPIVFGPHMQNFAAIAASFLAKGGAAQVHNADELADELGVSPRRMRAIIRNRHERFGVGWQVPGTNQWLVRPSEVEYLRPAARYRRKSTP